MSVRSAIGTVVTGTLSTYEVRTVTKGRTSDNKAYVSSQTGGKTFRVAGNKDATMEVSLYGEAGWTEVPAALREGLTVTVHLNNDSKTYNMIIDSSSLEVDVEAGELVGVSLSLSAVDADSYPA